MTATNGVEPGAAAGAPRLLHVTQPVDGGTARLVVQLSAAAAAAGYAVTVASPYDATFVHEVQASGASWTPLALTRAPEAADLGLLLALRRLLADHDVVHLHSSKAGALGRLAALSLPRRSRPRVVFTPHGWSFYVGGRAAPLYRWWERAVATVADVVTVVSAQELDDGRRVLGRRARLRLVENGVDVTSFSPAGPAAPRAPGPLLVQVGRLSRQKAQDRAVTALAGLTDRTVRLRLVGSGPLEGELRRLIEDLGVADRVELVGTADPRSHLRAADVVLQPSRWEGMSLSLLEAMATGRAVVASDCGGSDALGDESLLVPHVDDAAAVLALRSRVDELLADPGRRARHGAANRERVERRFDLTRTTRTYLEVWRHQVEPRRGGLVSSHSTDHTTGEHR